MCVSRSTRDCPWRVGQVVVSVPACAPVLTPSPHDATPSRHPITHHDHQFTTAHRPPGPQALTDAERLKLAPGPSTLGVDLPFELKALEVCLDVVSGGEGGGRAGRGGSGGIGVEERRGRAATAGLRTQAQHQTIGHCLHAPSPRHPLRPAGDRGRSPASPLAHLPATRP